MVFRPSRNQGWQAILTIESREQDHCTLIAASRAGRLSDMLPRVTNLISLTGIILISVDAIATLPP
jgi:hypothetical protein